MINKPIQAAIGVSILALVGNKLIAKGTDNRQENKKLKKSDGAYNNTHLPDISTITSPDGTK